eukprot:RCo028402
MQLDKSKFESSLTVVALRLPLKLVDVVMRKRLPFRLNRGRLHSLIHDPVAPEAARLLLLDEAVKLDALPEPLAKLVEELSLELTMHTLKVGYDDMTADEVLRSILPAELAVPSSFEQVGHIAHLNLRDGHLAFKDVIGQVLLEKTPTLRTVVNKTTAVEGQFRELPMELLAGEDDFDVEVKQHGCVFRFNYRQVYWNSRLQTEHQRLISTLAPEDYLHDVMAGVGPFAIPAAKKGLRVVNANDLNPHCFAALQTNAKLNKVAAVVQCFNMDGREFIQHCLKQFVASDRTGGSGQPQAALRAKQGAHHFVMNLPALAVTFLDAFRTLREWPAPSGGIKPPTVVIHVYLFTTSDDLRGDSLRQVEEHLGKPLGEAAIRAV